MENEIKETSETAIKWFSEINKNSISIVGEKAAYLGEAYNKKIISSKVKIPEGFVITKKGVSDFFEKNQISQAISNIFEEIDWNNADELKRASEQAKSLIMRSDLPASLKEEINDSYENLGISKVDLEKGSALDILGAASEPIFVAVRNSYDNDKGDSYFNIKGKTNLTSSIKKSIASLFTPEILKEEKEKGISPEKIRTALIIQKMIQAEKSGIMFSRDILEINSIWGMGGGLKIEEIGKDKYHVRRDFKILDKEIAEKKYAVTRESSGSLKLVQLKEGYSFEQVLTEGEMQDIADAALRIDDIFQEKTQFEFAIESDEISIVKIEPLKEIEKKEEPKEPEEVKEEIIEEPETIEEKEETHTYNILPPEEITQTKIMCLVRNEIEKEKSKETGIKRGFITLEESIKERGLHPNYYLENFNTKGYGELIYSSIKNMSQDLDEVWVRLSDFTSDEFENLEGAPEKKERNPLMGLCGIRYLISKPELLKREVKAISELSKSKKEVGLLIPKITSVYELKKVKEILENIDSKVKVGIILETPASIQLIKDFIDEGIDVMSFSGNSLTRYLLAVDPKNKSLKDFYDDTSPALMYQIEYVIRVCKRNNVRTSFFGNSLKKKEMVEYLVKKGINSIVLAPEEVHDASKLILRAEEEFISGTDKEIRQYELNKEKQRQQKEMNDFEKIKDMQASQEIKKISKEKNKIEEEKIEEAVEAIEEEKEEYLKENPEEDKGETPEIKAEEELKESPEETFDDSPENLEDLGPNDTPNKSLDEVEKAMKEIEEHNKKNSPETKELITEELRETPSEKFENTPESFKTEEAVEAIEEEKEEYLKENPEEDKDFADEFEESSESKSQDSQKGDTLGIFK